MKPIRLFLFSLLASALVAGASIPLRGDTLSHGISPDPSLNLPAVKQIALPNGISAYYIRDDLPVLTLTAAVGYGSLYEDIKTAGTASLLAKTLSLAGSKKYPGPALYEAVESLGGKLSVSSSWEQTTISVTVLARHAEKAFDIVSSIVSEPNLDEKYINDARALIIEGIRRKQDQAQLVAFDKLRELIFNGKGYGATETEGSVRAIRREDLAAVTARAVSTAATRSSAFPPRFPRMRFARSPRNIFRQSRRAPARNTASAARRRSPPCAKRREKFFSSSGRSLRRPLPWERSPRRSATRAFSRSRS
jgi:hypothetical protein